MLGGEGGKVNEKKKKKLGQESGDKYEQELYYFLTY
jgi:hypothetical protein